jgi:hypothetical protein
VPPACILNCFNAGAYRHCGRVYSSCASDATALFRFSPLFYFSQRWSFTVAQIRNRERIDEINLQKIIMSSPNELADPIAKGVIPTALQNLSDLLVWKQRIIVTNDFGEETCEWQTPEPLKNPFSLLAQLNARDVSAFNSETSPTIFVSAIHLQSIVALLYLRPSCMDS